MIGFKANGRLIRFILPLPSKDEERFKVSPSGRRKYDQSKQYQQWEQACRQAWRALALVVKAKLEAVESGITTFWRICL